ncbi:MAG: hypothetical protein ACYTFG_18820, partial [Planctomycetota bacterium]
KGARVFLLGGDRSWLATEVVKGLRGGFVNGEKAGEIVESLVFQDLPLKKGEKALFDSTGDPEGLELCLRGYKVRSGRRKGARARGGRK